MVVTQIHALCLLPLRWPYVSVYRNQVSVVIQKHLYIKCTMPKMFLVVSVYFSWLEAGYRRPRSPAGLKSMKQQSFTEATNTSTAIIETHEQSKYIAVSSSRGAREELQCAG